jgi:PAP2 superfamily protein
MRLPAGGRGRGLALLLLMTATSAAAQSVEPVQPEPVEQAPAKEPPPPEPSGTDWRSLMRDTGKDFVAFPRRRSTWVLLAAGGALALAVHPADDYVEEHIVGNETAERFFAIGKVVGSGAFQVGAAGSLWLIGRYVVPEENGSKTNKVSHLGFDLLRAQIVSGAFVQAIKNSVRRDRPTGECCAFPSGHSTSAFAAASVLERHFGYRASWPALAAATYVATSRLVDNRHFLSDVVFGAALGEAVGWTIVGRHGRSGYALQPIPIPGGMMVALVRQSD